MAGAPGPDVLLATCRQLPDGDPDTRLLARHLRSAGIAAAVRPWDDEATDWAGASLTLIRSTWDYHVRRADFLSWAARVPRLNNPATLVEWNSDKRYLLDLPHAVPTPETHVLESPTPTTVARAMDELGIVDAVLKPAVGLDGHGVVRLHRDRLGGVRRSGPWLLQPFLEMASTVGETSVVLVEGRCTHAVRRRPPPGDFRAQERLGGTVSPCSPSDEMADLATRAVAWLDPLPLYARVDIVAVGSELAVMELELIEPSLFLDHGPAGLDALEHAIRRGLEPARSASVRDRS